MIKPKFILTAFAAVLLFNKVNAQVDTTRLDLGRMQLEKEFTQNITIKGEDLEKMPFVNLADAINVWFYGTYTNKLNVVYVIDGNLANDVNAYSIYDIEEVTLVQNSLTQLNGTNETQQLILIKTKRNKGKGSGVIAKAQANVNSLYTNNTSSGQANSYQTGLKSTTELYQQYYVSAYTNTNNIHAGLSADFLRDVPPMITESNVNYITPDHINRLKFNGYFNADLGRSTLDITAGYAPQKATEAYEINNLIDDAYTQNESVFNGTIKLTTHILPGFTNSFHADYNNYKLVEKGELIQSFQNNSTVNYETFGSNVYQHNMGVYDNLSYNVKFGDWGLEPSANLNFRSFKDSSYNHGSETSNNGNPPGIYYNSSSFKQHYFLLTGSLNLYYKTYFNIEAGLLSNLATFSNIDPSTSVPVSRPAKQFPFVTASADVMQLIDPKANLSIKVYGSYSVSDVISDPFSSLNDFNNTNIQLPILGPYMNGTQTASVGESLFYNFENYAFGTYNEKQSFKKFSAGLNITPFKSGLVFSYFFDKSNYLSPVYIFIPAYVNTTGNLLIYSNTNSTLNRLSIDYTFNTSSLNWHTGINATMLTQKYPQTNVPIGSTGSNVWTGGWVNRLNYRSFFAGVDVLYRVGEKIYTVSSTAPNTLNSTTINSFSLQSIYAGYRIKVSKLKSLEAFANARNIFQNKKEDITDGRKYYGLGFSLAF